MSICLWFFLGNLLFHQSLLESRLGTLKSHYYMPGVFLLCFFVVFTHPLIFRGPFQSKDLCFLVLDNSHPSFLHMLLTSIHSMLCFCKAIRWIYLPCLLTFLINFDQYGLWKNSFLDLLALSFTLQLYPFSFSSHLFTHF